MKRPVLIALWLAFLWLGYVTASILVEANRRSTIEPADAVIVLGAGVDIDRPSPVLQARLDAAMNLFDAKLHLVMILTGGKGEGDLLAESEAGKRYCIDEGIPSDRILIEDQSRTTLENLEKAREIMDARHLSTAVIVSDPLHLRRAQLMARGLKIDARVHPARPTAFKTLRTQFPFLLREIYFLHHYWLLGQ